MFHFPSRWILLVSVSLTHSLFLSCAICFFGHLDGGDESSLPPSVCSELAALPKQPLVELAGKERAEGAKTDKMEESLTCIICQDLLHDCVR